jgi:hypothetical protein
MIIEFLRKLYVRQFLTPAYPSIPASELDMPAYERGKSDYESMPQKFLVAKVANPFEPTPFGINRGRPAIETQKKST